VAGGFTAAAGLAGAEAPTDAIWIGTLVPEGMSPADAAAERTRMARVQRIAQALAPLAALPERQRGRRAMAEDIARSLGLTVSQVYRLEARVRAGGQAALAQLGARADRGRRRHVVSEAWEAWCAQAHAAGASAALAGDAAPSAETVAQTTLAATAALAQVVRAAWVGGAPSARQAWLKASAALARQVIERGAPQALAVGLLQVPCPRDWIEAEGRQYRTAGLALRDAKGAYDRHITPVVRSAAGYRPGQLVCGDVSPLDIPVRRPDGSTGYGRMIMWHDFGSNWLQCDLYLVERGEGIRREHVAASFAKMCEESPFGVPERLYLDNGSEYKWEDLLLAWHDLAALTGQRIAVDLAVYLPEAARLVRSIPYHPRGKRVEGQFGNLRHWLAWWFGYVGGNRLAKKTASLGQAPVLSDFDSLRDWLQRELADYHVTPQERAEHMGGMSPQQRLDWHLSTGWRPVRIDRHALMLAFAQREVRTVTRGAIRWAGREYTADFLMHVEGRVLAAQPRVCAADLDYLYVFDASRGSLQRGQFLGIATPQPIYGVLDEEGAKEAARRRKAFRLLTGERVAAAGGPLDEAALAGTRAQLLGLHSTVERARAAAQEVQVSAEHRQMLAARAELEHSTRVLLAQADAARDAESLSRLAHETEDEAAARAAGF
jgi:hypothetical protein